MGISLKTHKMLWGRSGNMCAFPDCKKILVVDETATDDHSLIGQESHIVAQKENGPRGNSPLTLDQRDKYDNLILLCSNHHTIVDSQQNEYTVEKLKHFKKDHENWVKRNLITDAVKIKDDELYASYIEQFVIMTDLHNWKNWTSFLLGSSEVFLKEQYESLQKLPDYIVSRIWPGRYMPLENALINFKSVLNNLMYVFHKYIQERGDGYTTERFYKHAYRERNPNYSFEREKRH